jgi:hypothetical protein
MEKIEPILLQSIHHYERILDFLQEMDVEIGTAAPSMVLELSESLAYLQGHATETDQTLLTQLRKQTALPETIQSLLGRREYLVKEILILNARIKAKAIGIKSLLGHEMEKMRNGISALSGYRQQQHNQGHIVNSTL